MIPFDPVVFWILVVWLTLFGACIGSFLNVVVYRLPLGKSLSDPPSHCPNCKHPIRWFDNVPVFGWLFLHGKCRDCREPISPRYPIIEAICGVVFGSIAFQLLNRGGDASLQEFFCLTLALSTLVVTLLAAGLIELDGQKIPLKLFIPAALMGPMVPYLIQESFHVMVYFESIRSKSDTVYLGTVLHYIAYNYMLAVFYFAFTNDCFWMISAALIGLYLGSLGMIVVLLAMLFLLVLKIFTRFRSSQFVLTFTVFAFVLIVLA